MRFRIEEVEPGAVRERNNARDVRPVFWKPERGVVCVANDTESIGR
jgi:hypothetical protein